MDDVAGKSCQYMLRPCLLLLLLLILLLLLLLLLLLWVEILLVGRRMLKGC